MTFGCLRSRGCLRSAAPLGAAAQGLAGRGHAGHHAGHGAQRPPQQGLAPGQPWGARWGPWRSTAKMADWRCTLWLCQNSY